MITDRLSISSTKPSVCTKTPPEKTTTNSSASLNRRQRRKLRRLSGSSRRFTTPTNTKATCPRMPCKRRWRNSTKHTKCCRTTRRDNDTTMGRIFLATRADLRVEIRLVNHSFSVAVHRLAVVGLLVEETLDLSSDLVDQLLDCGCRAQTREQGKNMNLRTTSFDRIGTRYKTLFLAAIWLTSSDHLPVLRNLIRRLAKPPDPSSHFNKPRRQIRLGTLNEFFPCCLTILSKLRRNRSFRERVFPGSTEFAHRKKEIRPCGAVLRVLRNLHPLHLTPQKQSQFPSATPQSSLFEVIDSRPWDTRSPHLPAVRARPPGRRVSPPLPTCTRAPAPIPKHIAATFNRATTIEMDLAWWVPGRALWKTSEPDRPYLRPPQVLDMRFRNLRP